MRILDRYLLRQFFAPLGYCIGAFWLMYVLYDLLGDKLSDFLTWQISIGLIVQYYLLTAPDFLAQTMPLALLLALLYALSTLSKHQELNAMRASGLALGRAALPVLVVGLLSSILIFLVVENVVPWATTAAQGLLYDAQVRFTLRQNASPDAAARLPNPYDVELNVQVDLTHRYWHARVFNTRSHELRDVDVSQETTDGGKDLIKISAARALWLDHEWWFFDGTIYDYTQTSLGVARRKTFTNLRREDFTETPVLFLAKLGQRKASKMTAVELREYLRFYPSKPRRDLAPYRTRLHDRYAQPFSCLMVFLVGVPLGARFSRRGPLLATASALGLLVLFWLARKIILPFGESDSLEPWVAAWLPYFLFSVVGVGLFTQLE